MIGLALKVGIRAVMQGHMYQLDGKVHLQSEGGPFGLELSGHLSPILPLVSQSREGLWVPEVRHTIYSMESLGRF